MACKWTSEDFSDFDIRQDIPAADFRACGRTRHIADVLSKDSTGDPKPGWGEGPLEGASGGSLVFVAVIGIAGLIWVGRHMLASSKS